METGNTQRPWGRKGRLAAIAVLCFGLLWTCFLVGALTAAACRNDAIGLEKRATYCSISIAFGKPFDILPHERAKRSEIQLERGIVSVQLGRMERARADFLVATRVMIQSRHQYIKMEHMRRIAGFRGGPVEALWFSVIEELEAQGF